MFFQDCITTESELRDLLGSPTPFVAHKAIDHLDDHCRAFLALSPIALLATADASGACDVSPRGDRPGFALVVDDRHLVLPDRPGNRRLDSMCNLLENASVGLIFLIPGLEETLRINGTAVLTREARWLEAAAVDGKAPQVALGITVAEIFIQCAKALKRSKLWQPDTWPASAELPRANEILAAHARMPGVTAKDVARNLADSYRTLY